jgi:hypothetical protein
MISKIELQNKKQNKTNLVAFSSQAKYTDWATAVEGEFSADFCG